MIQRHNHKPKNDNTNLEDNDMKTQPFYVAAIVLLTTAAIVRADSFIIQAADHCMACNDAQIGPDSTRRTTISDIRNYQDASTTRRRIAFYSYDISSIKQPGKVFANCYLTLNVDKGTSGKNLYVYAVKEDYDNIVLNGKTWNTLPGLVRNPAPTRGSEITIDVLNMTELSPLLMSFPRPALDVWESTPVSALLDDVLNADTDNNILLLFVTYDAQNSDFEICSPSHSTKFSTNPVLGGILLRGDIVVPSRATSPVPANYANVGIGLSQLSWTNPEPNEVGGIITCDVYLGTNEPNLAKPGYNLNTLVTGTKAQSVSIPAGLIQRNTTYYWIVDVHDTTRGLTQGYVWTFNTNNNPPQVTTGGTQYLWLNNAGDPTSATAILSGSATDDGYPAPLTLLWEQVSGPATVTIDPSNVAQTTVILPAIGDYLFRLTANDTDLQGTGLTQIYVRADPCQAAQIKPGYTVIPGDFNNDCMVNMTDFAEIAKHWLECNSLAPCE